jgi:hypothetical protein
VVDGDLDYATVKKTRQKGRIVKVERTVVFGTEESVRSRLENSPGKTINTSYIERSNLDGGYGMPTWHVKHRPSLKAVAG